jgi:hypothetical protein
MKVTGIYERRFYTVEVENDMYERGSAKEWAKFNTTDESWDLIDDPTYIETAFQAVLDTEIHYLIDEDAEE